MPQPKYFVINIDPKSKDVVDEVSFLMAIIAGEMNKVCKVVSNIFGSEVRAYIRQYGFISKFKSQFELMVSASADFAETKEEIVESLYDLISRGCKNTSQKEEIPDPKELTNDLAQALGKICDIDVDVQFIEAAEKCLTTIRRHLDNHSTITVNAYRCWNKYIPPTGPGPVELPPPTGGKEEDEGENTQASGQKGLFGTEDMTGGANQPPDRTIIDVTSQGGSSGSENVSGGTDQPPDEQLVDGSGHNGPLVEEGGIDGTEPLPGGHNTNGPEQQTTHEILELELGPNYSARHGKLQIDFFLDGFRTSMAMSRSFADHLINLVRSRLAGKIQIEVKYNTLGQMVAVSLIEEKS